MSHRERALSVARTRGVARARDFKAAGVPLVYLKRLTDAGVKVPTVVITAFPEAHVRARAEAGGAIGFLAKPFDSRDLVKLLNEAVGV